jgi:leader peptidase (prepilin peptidase) / N-methyltransferase
MASFSDEPRTSARAVRFAGSPGAPGAAVRLAAAVRTRDALSGLVALALVAASFLSFGAGFDAVLAAFVACVLVAISAVDIQERRVPNRIVLPATGALLVAQAAIHPERVVESVLAGLGAALFLLLPTIAYPGAIGLGDVKLAFFIGAALGASIVPALALGFCAAGAGGLFILLLRGKQARKAAIPFAPFLAFGALAVLLV